MSQGPNPKGRVLSNEEMTAFKGMSSTDVTLRMLDSFGYTLDDVRIHPQTNVLLFPLDVAYMMEAYKQGLLDTFTSMPNIEYHIGMKVTMRHLSDESLNGKPFTIIKVYPDEHKILIDASPSMSTKGSEPHAVRYVKVPWSKAILIHRETTSTALNIISCTQAANLNKAFKDAGLDALKLECLEVRKHPMVEQGRAFRDVPQLCGHLNRIQAKGYPFRVEFGHQIFSMGNRAVMDEFLGRKSGTKTSAKSGAGALRESSFSSEPYVLIVNCNGCRIDMAPDIYDGLSGPDAKFHQHKLYIPDPRFNIDSWNNMVGAMDMYMSYGMLPTAPWHEEIYDDKAVNLGMIRGDLNQEWPNPDKKVVMVHLFNDSGLDMSRGDNMKMHSELVGLRRESVMRGSILMSGNLAVTIATKHANDHVMDCTFGTSMETGTICFCCYMRITIEEAITCIGCGKARYCSFACQLMHLKDHKKSCASAEERQRRRQAHARAQKEREDRLRRHDQHEAIARAEQEAKEAKRKALAQRTRAENIDNQANDLAERIRRAAPKPQPVGAKGKDRSAKRTTEEQLVHDQWDSKAERTIRIQAFQANQEAEKLEAQARKLQEKLDGMKRLAKEVSASAEAAAHHVPPPPKISDYV
jgi:hypothetical protein